MEKHFMIDIETTGGDKQKDDILEIALVELEYRYPYWHQTGRVFHELLPYAGEPETVFAKENMSDLYKKCNDIESRGIGAGSDLPIYHKALKKRLHEFIHSVKYFKEVEVEYNHGRKENRAELVDIMEVYPKFFMGWNASNFDIPFMFAKELLVPSFYEKVAEDKEELRGDVHYRIYEQTGALNVISNLTGLTRKTIKAIATDLNPTGLKLPVGKSHDALYDCHSQLIMMNGLIKIGRMGIQK